MTSPNALSVTTSSLPQLTVGDPVDFPLQSSGGLGEDIWTLTSGSLPAGLALDSSNGQIIGTPTSIGTSTFTIEATDAESPPATASASISAKAVSASTALTISSAALPGGIAGSDYSEQLTSQGGTAPVLWSISSGSLPSGLSLDQATGIVSGTATQAGAFTFSVQATDSNSPNQNFCKQERELSIASDAPLDGRNQRRQRRVSGPVLLVDIGCEWRRGSLLVVHRLRRAARWTLNRSHHKRNISGVPTQSSARLRSMNSQRLKRVPVRSLSVSLFDHHWSIDPERRRTVHKSVPAATVGEYYTANVRKDTLSEASHLIRGVKNRAIYRTGLLRSDHWRDRGCARHFRGRLQSPWKLSDSSSQPRPQQ